MRTTVICLFINFFVCTAAKSQQIIPSTINADTPAKYISHETNLLNSFILPAKVYPVKTISPSYITSDIGYFCKKELQLEKALKFPVKMRLGSMDYNDKMENKSWTRVGTAQTH